MSAVLARTLSNALRGVGAHLDSPAALDGLAWELAGARPAGSPYSAYRILNHLIYWQDVFVRRADGAHAPTPPHDADGWPGDDAPTSETDWLGAVARFGGGLAALQARAAADPLDEPLPGPDGRTRADAIAAAAAHNSYHLGQIVLLRRMLGAWPPPAGGDSW